MTQLKIRGSTQILDASIPSSKLINGGRFVLRTVTGEIDMANKRVQNAAAPLNANDLTTKSYVDAIVITGIAGDAVLDGGFY